MFQIDPNNSAITMHRGDTGAYWVTLTRSSGDPFGEDDRAIYTVKSGAEILIEREYALDDDEGAGNGKFLVAFRNSDTDTWAAGQYQTEIRVAINPIRDSSGKIADGDTIRTITASKSSITIMDVLKEI